MTATISVTFTINCDNLKERYSGDFKKITETIENEYSLSDFEKVITGDILTSVKRYTEENKGHIHCPVNAWDCPYFDANGCCMMYPDSDPLKECDDFGCFWNEGDNYICYENH